jgi:hypothetical protein
MRDLSQMVTESSHPEELHRGIRFTGHRPGDGLYLHRCHLDDFGEEIQNTQSYDW